MRKLTPSCFHADRQLTDAKARLAKMEEVIAMISSAKSRGQNLRDVMPADYLAILENAEVGNHLLILR